MTAQVAIDPEDWVTLWQSEMAALAVDREQHEMLAGTVRLWAEHATQGGAAGDAAAGRPGTDAPPRAAPLGPAPGLGGGLDERCRHIAGWSPKPDP